MNGGDVTGAADPVLRRAAVAPGSGVPDSGVPGSVVVENLGKRYRQPIPAGRGAAGSGRWTARGEFWALREVSLRLAPGQCVGIVGNNGAGKSTLLRLIGGVGAPDAGRVRAAGRIGAILDLGAGLSDDLSGRENAHVAGVISGMTRAELDRRLGEIVAFAELEEFIDAPLRTYSDGMRMRLAFSVAAHIEPDILLIDEALAVGDAGFQRRCLARIAAMKDRGCTTLIVSHDMAQLRALCDDLLYLDRGRAVAFGPTAEILARYEGASRGAAAERAEGAGDPAGAAAGPAAGPAVARVRLFTARGRPADTIVAGTGLIVEADYCTGGRAGPLHARVAIERADGVACLRAGTEIPGDAPDPGLLQLTIERLDLVPGHYAVTVALRPEGAAGPAAEGRQAFSVVGPPAGAGVIGPPVRWQARRVT